MMRDAEFKQRSLARLFAWKERKKQEKEALGQTRKQHVVYADNRLDLKVGWVGLAFR